AGYLYSAIRSSAKSRLLSSLPETSCGLTTVDDSTDAINRLFNHIIATVKTSFCALNHRLLARKKASLAAGLEFFWVEDLEDNLRAEDKPTKTDSSVVDVGIEVSVGIVAQSGKRRS